MVSQHSKLLVKRCTKEDTYPSILLLVKVPVATAPRPQTEPNLTVVGFLRGGGQTCSIVSQITKSTVLTHCCLANYLASDRRPNALGRWQINVAMFQLCVLRLRPKTRLLPAADLQWNSNIALEFAPSWLGISERTIERGERRLNAIWKRQRSPPSTGMKEHLLNSRLGSLHTIRQLQLLLQR